MRRLVEFVFQGYGCAACQVKRCCLEGEHSHDSRMGTGEPCQQPLPLGVVVLMAAYAVSGPRDHRR